jgi:hypothetical protein
MTAFAICSVRHPEARATARREATLQVPPRARWEPLRVEVFALLRLTGLGEGETGCGMGRGSPVPPPQYRHPDAVAKGPTRSGPPHATVFARAHAGYVGIFIKHNQRHPEPQRRVRREAAVRILPGSRWQPRRVDVVDAPDGPERVRDRTSRTRFREAALGWTCSWPSQRLTEAMQCQVRSRR